MVEEGLLAEHVARVADAFAERNDELLAYVAEVYQRELPHLVHDDESVVALLGASMFQMLDASLRIFKHRADPWSIEAPAAAVEYARRLAQRGTPVVDLVRAYYLALSALYQFVPDEALREPVGKEMLTAILSDYLTGGFVIMDKVTRQVVSEYQEERDRWLLNRSAVRAAQVREVLGGDGSDLDAAEAALGYGLRGTHLAAIVWERAPAAPGSRESMISALAAELPITGAPLVVPADESCSWVWFPLSEPVLPDEDHVRQVLAGVDPAVHLVLGDPAAGIGGFRGSHRQATRVHSLAAVAGEDAERCLAFRDVGALALMATDLPAARTWVTDTLGPLAASDEQHERLRETLLVFLATGSSYTAAAAKLAMHKNSVQYRVRKAEETLGHPVTGNRLEVELALKLCRRLGSAVLRER